MKTIEEFRKLHDESQLYRVKFIRKYGEILTSVWNVKYDKRFTTDDNVSQSQHRDNDYLEKFNNSEVQLNQAKKYMGVRDISCRKKDIFSVSKFPKNICENIIKFYTKENDIVLDPCSGHNSRMETTFKLRRNYIGYDVSESYMKENKRIAKELFGNSEQKLLLEVDNDIILYLQSSEKMNENDNSVDLIFTSPPYWDLEFYGDESAQLGYKKSYDEFLSGIKRILSESFRVLKVDKYCIINVNDFRKNGIFYDYHNDIIRIARECCFKLHDIIIMKYKTAMRSAFAKQIDDSKIMPKIHEYILVFKKSSTSDMISDNSEFDDTEDVLSIENDILNESQNEDDIET